MASRYTIASPAIDLNFIFGLHWRELRSGTIDFDGVYSVSTADELLFVVVIVSKTCLCLNMSAMENQQWEPSALQSSFAHFTYSKNGITRPI